MDLVSCAPPDTPSPGHTHARSGRTRTPAHHHTSLTVSPPVSFRPGSDPADVEFQRAFALLLKTHRGALRANRRFWRLLVRSELAFRHLSDAFASMDATEQRADRAYRAMLERYPKSVKLKRAFFLVFPPHNTPHNKARRIHHIVKGSSHAAARAWDLPARRDIRVFPRGGSERPVDGEAALRRGAEARGGGRGRRGGRGRGRGGAGERQG